MNCPASLIVIKGARLKGRVTALAAEEAEVVVAA
jgi:hypothetical protein